MDLLERLKIYMNHLGMTSSVFADAAQIPRPTLSQILSGRNKKISNELITKLHDAFPRLNVMWLMFGDGDMEVGENIEFSEPQKEPISDIFASQPTENPQPTQPNLFENFVTDSNQSVQNRPVVDTQQQNPGLNHQNQSPQQPQRQSSQPTAQSVQEVLVNGRRSTRFINADDAPKGNDSSTPNKRIESIMVFYSDNSFEVFRPAQ